MALRSYSPSVENYRSVLITCACLTTWTVFRCSAILPTCVELIRQLLHTPHSMKYMLGVCSQYTQNPTPNPISLGSTQATDKVEETQTPFGYDCSNIWIRNPKSTTGIYTIKPTGANSTIQVFCEMNDDGGWTLIQKHDGQDNLPFDRSWYDYKQGFGNISGEHWLGLDNIYLLTNQEKRISELRVSLGDFAGSEAFAGYSTFNIDPESKFYKLSLGNYSGNAGDAFRGQCSATNQDGSLFSTKDKDNDNCDACRVGDMAFRSCSNDQFKSGWWFNSCGIADLNGQWRTNGEHIGWASAVSWKTWRTLESLKFSKMSVRHN
ncbi:angiopoietin-related protein 5-like [Spea bombifrons]|uniref:angiopoietin-related protein 5-like n=1 Tax=Spea bombifrons TaxID=233779 RepID=UPI00234A01F2|nr:angiopoietin-related protein 5-like [Spea bombifrons]